MKEKRDWVCSSDLLTAPSAPPTQNHQRSASKRYFTGQTSIQTWSDSVAKLLFHQILLISLPMAVLVEGSGELAGGGAYAGSLFTQARTIDAILL